MLVFGPIVARAGSQRFRCSRSDKKRSLALFPSIAPAARETTLRRLAKSPIRSQRKYFCNFWEAGDCRVVPSRGKVNSELCCACGQGVNIINTGNTYNEAWLEAISRSDTLRQPLTGSSIIFRSIVPRQLDFFAANLTAPSAVSVGRTFASRRSVWMLGGPYIPRVRSTKSERENSSFHPTQNPLWQE